jgi:hypothetical protein
MSSRPVLAGGSGFWLWAAAGGCQVQGWQVWMQLVAAHMLVLCWCMSAAGIYDPAFIAANQEARADNIIKGGKQQQVGTRDS